MIEKAVGLGLGYLVYKGLMAELTKEPDNGGVKVSEAVSKGMLGFKGLTTVELGQAITGTAAGQFGGGGFQPRDPSWTGGFGLTGTPIDPKYGWGTGWEDWNIRTGSLLPEDFELVGPSRTGITRPKGLD